MINYKIGFLEIHISMFNTALTKEILKDNSFDTDLVIVANTYQNISNETLIKKLTLLNAILNRKLFRHFQKYPEKRVMFICAIERVKNNTHSHILLKIPKEYDRDRVLKLMSDNFRKLDDRFNKKFILFNEKANNVVGNVIYSLKGLFRYDHNKLVVI